MLTHIKDLTCFFSLTIVGFSSRESAQERLKKQDLGLGHPLSSSSSSLSDELASYGLRADGVLFVNGSKASASSK